MSGKGSRLGGRNIADLNDAKVAEFRSKFMRPMAQALVGFLCDEEHRDMPMREIPWGHERAFAVVSLAANLAASIFMDFLLPKGLDPEIIRRGFMKLVELELEDEFKRHPERFEQPKKKTEADMRSVIMSLQTEADRMEKLTEAVLKSRKGRSL